MLSDDSSNSAPQGASEPEGDNAKPQESAPKPKPAKPRIQKPDEMTGEVLEFINALDDFKRREMTAHLPWEQVLLVVRELGYQHPEDLAPKREVKRFEGALANYRKNHGRLFPNWSEVFSVVVEMGYRKDD